MATTDLSSRLALPQITLCAVSSVNVAATIRALKTSLAKVDFAACKFFTDSPVKPDHPAITIVPIPRITSSHAYSQFILSKMVDHIDTTHCLVTQWDGHVLNTQRWRAEFLDHDYIGASWPQFADGYDVGNGGFSLRSRRLMQLCRAPDFKQYHPEDVAIGRINRDWLERCGMRFASRALADMFSAERAGSIASSFGYHGAWLMPRAIGTDAFWALYRGLDDRATIRHDIAVIVKQMLRQRDGCKRALQLMKDHAMHAARHGRR